MLPSTPQVEAVYLDPANGILAGLQDLPIDIPSLPSPAIAHHQVPQSSATENLSSTTTFSQPSSPSDTTVPPETTSESPHTVLIDQTTLDPTTASRVAQTIQSETGGRALMLDAPVSGGKLYLSQIFLLIVLLGIVAAAAGLLTIMFGTPSPLATSLARPLLERMAREGGVIECGGNGTGVGVKVCNKYYHSFSARAVRLMIVSLILAINQIALAEGLALGRSLSIDPLLLHNVVNSSSGQSHLLHRLVVEGILIRIGQSWSSRVNSPLAEVANSPGSRNYTGGFQSRLMLKV